MPSLLRYACDLRTNIGLLPPARAVAPLPPPGSGEEGSTEVLAAVMGGRPLVTLEFAQMEVGWGLGNWTWAWRGMGPGVDGVEVGRGSTVGPRVRTRRGACHGMGFAGGKRGGKVR